ncbi:MAG TPA: hypothetical protein VFR58_17185, partial [Flavisolibacter sp.]|nr:hypothetical protein [Flavisolibacter sp.]
LIWLFSLSMSVKLSTLLLLLTHALNILKERQNVSSLMVSSQRHTQVLPAIFIKNFPVSADRLPFFGKSNHSETFPGRSAFCWLNLFFAVIALTK